MEKDKTVPVRKVITFADYCIGEFEVDYNFKNISEVVQKIEEKNLAQAYKNHTGKLPSNNILSVAEEVFNKLSVVQ